MKFKGITDVFFDLDHTLWDFNKNSALTFNKVFEINNLNVDLNKFLSYYESINLKYWKLYREEKIDKEFMRFGRLFDAFTAIDIRLEKNIINKLSEDYIIHLRSFNHLFENTFEILEYLKTNYNLHIITNGFSKIQQIKMENSKINHYFKTITNAESVGVKKPNPKIFNHALRVANVNPNQSIMIGDSYEADILGAMNMGMKAIFFGVYKKDLDTEIKQVDNLILLKNFL